MLVGRPQYDYDDQLGWSITSAIKKVGNVAVKTVTVPTKYAVKGTVAAAKGTVKVAKVTGKVIYQAHAIPTKWLAIKPTMWLAEKAMAPVKSRVQKIVHRRAAKLAFDRRKSTTPTPAEVSEARSWTRSKLKSELPHGPILSVFAGATPYDYMMLGNYQLGIAPAVAAAAVPVLVAAVSALINRYSSSGEAPANPGADAKAEAAAPDAPVAPGEVDMAPVQDAADAAKDAIDQAASAATGRKPAGRTVALPGGMKVQQSHLMIGGAIFGVLLLAMMFKGKS